MPAYRIESELKRPAPRRLHARGLPPKSPTCLPASMAFMAARRALPVALSGTLWVLPPEKRTSSEPISAMKREGSQESISRACLRCSQ